MLRTSRPSVSRRRLWGCHLPPRSPVQQQAKEVAVAEKEISEAAAWKKFGTFLKKIPSVLRYGSKLGCRPAEFVVIFSWRVWCDNCEAIAIWIGDTRRPRLLWSFCGRSRWSRLWQSIRTQQHSRLGPWSGTFFGTLQVRGALFHVIDQSTFEDFAIERAIQWDINPYKSYKSNLNIGCPVGSCVHIIAQVQSPTRPAPCLCLASSTAGRHWCLLALTQQKLSEHVPTLPEKVKTTCVLWTTLNFRIQFPSLEWLCMANQSVFHEINNWGATHLTALCVLPGYRRDAPEPRNAELRQYGTLLSEHYRYCRCFCVRLILRDRDYERLPKFGTTQPYYRYSQWNKTTEVWRPRVAKLGRRR